MPLTEKYPNLSRSTLRRHLRKVSLLYFLHGWISRICFEISAITHTLHWQATRHRRLTQPQALPIPPPRLRHRVHGALELNSFLSTGYCNFSDLISIIENTNLQSGSGLSILDFGCGCSRTLRHFLHSKPEWRYYATDIDEEAMRWNSRYLPDNVAWSLNNIRPPLQFRDAQFDVILAVSVFTHLDEQLQFAWLREFSKVLKKSGIVIASIHGSTVWESSEEWSRRLQENGFLHLQTNTGIRNFARTPKHYQTTLHSSDYITKKWGEKFDDIQVLEHCINNTQDAVILSQPRKNDPASRPSVISN